MNRKPKKWLIWGGEMKRCKYMFHPDDELVLCRSADWKHEIDISKIESFLTNKISKIYIESRIQDDIDTSMYRKKYFESGKLQLDELDFRNKINSLDIDVFYSFATAKHKPFLIQARNILLEDPYFNNILSIWNGDDMLESRYLDWMGTLEYATLSRLKIDNLPEISYEQIEILDNFMAEFRNKKIQPDKKQIQSLEEIQDQFHTTKSIAVIIAQCIGDTSLLIDSSSKKYHDYTWIAELIEKHPDVFFIIKDHPEQHSIYKNHPHESFWKEKKGPNWIYLPPNSEYDTLSLTMHADFAITVCSRGGFDTLYWTTLVSAVDRYRHKKICYYPEDFHANVLPKKRSDILKFMYYAITRCFFIPGLNGNKKLFHRWIDWTNQYRLSVGTSQVNLKQATIEELKYLTTE